MILNLIKISSKRKKNEKKGTYFLLLLGLGLTTKATSSYCYRR
jgi:hypothetical protein